jgi:hypothetical protein
MRILALFWLAGMTAFYQIPTPAIVITHVTVINPGTTSIEGDRTVVVTGDRWSPRPSGRPAEPSDTAWRDAVADAWLKDPDTVAKVRELYPPSSVMRGKMENDRRVFLDAMAHIKQGMVLGVDKNLYVEPTIWTVAWAQHHYKYPISRSN